MSMVSISNMTNELTQRNQKKFTLSNAITNDNRTKYNIPNNLQELNSRADIEVASNNREDQMAETKLERPAVTIRAYRGK